MTYYPITKYNKENGLHYTLDEKTFTYLPNLTVDEPTEYNWDRWGKEIPFQGLSINNNFYTDKEKAGKALKEAYIKACSFGNFTKSTVIGNYKGFEISVYFDTFSKIYKAELKNNTSLYVELGDSTTGNIIRFDNVIASLPTRIENIQSEIINQQNQMLSIEGQMKTPFQKEEELQKKSARLIEVNKLLNIDDNIRKNTQSIPYKQKEIGTSEKKPQIQKSVIHL